MHVPAMGSCWTCAQAKNGGLVTGGLPIKHAGKGNVRQNCLTHALLQNTALTILSDTTHLEHSDVTHGESLPSHTVQSRQATIANRSSGVAPQLCRPPIGHLCTRLDTHTSINRPQQSMSPTPLPAAILNHS